MITASTPNKETTPNRKLKYENEDNSTNSKPKLSDFVTAQTEVKSKEKSSVSVFRTGSKKKSVKKSEKSKK